MKKEGLNSENSGVSNEKLGVSNENMIEYHFVKFQKMWRLILTVRAAT